MTLQLSSTSISTITPILLPSITQSVFTTIYGNNNANTITGTAGHDNIYGRAGHDNIYGGNGINCLYGEGGNDILHGNQGTNRFFGGADYDTVDYTGASYRSATAIVDGNISVAAGGWLGVKVNANAGTSSNGWAATGDTFSYIERFLGTAYSDIFVLHMYADVGSGNGNDRIELYDGGTAYGGNGNDVIWIRNGGTGYGEAGHDQLNIGNIAATIYGGDGNDKLNNLVSTSDYSGGTSNIVAGDGNDVIQAGFGHININGGDGNDTIHVGAYGNQRISGGLDADTFIFTASDAYYGGATFINDFENGLDKFDLRETGITGMERLYIVDTAWGLKITYNVGYNSEDIYITNGIQKHQINADDFLFA